MVIRIQLNNIHQGFVAYSSKNSSCPGAAPPGDALRVEAMDAWNGGVGLRYLHAWGFRREGHREGTQDLDVNRFLEYSRS